MWFKFYFMEFLFLTSSKVWSSEGASCGFFVVFPSVGLGIWLSLWISVCYTGWCIVRTGSIATIVAACVWTSIVRVGIRTTIIAAWVWATVVAATIVAACVGWRCRHVPIVVIVVVVGWCCGHSPNVSTIMALLVGWWCRHSPNVSTIVVMVAVALLGLRLDRSGLLVSDLSLDISAVGCEGQNR